eukprot:NODE_9137_length_526_cov_251.150376_g9114_i0.p2 GENE.NODE_9137_length_526_cov_251.150376_g9114_i0~~NODE_9137_length_526_cov_251.150376_g9114_i0.p2  ORF type:complete len:112 (+),score=24.20 NODE_9137_length_526_cov_251.150376_g9114_i0:73-408(+)
MGEAPWDANLFECLADVKICLVSWCCGVCQLAHQKAVVEGHECGIGDLIITWLCAFCCAVKIRGAIRDKYGIGGSVLTDCLTVWLCGICALSQQHRQLILKGDKPAGCFMD